jgi:hypothetical protein
MKIEFRKLLRADWSHAILAIIRCIIFFLQFGYRTVIFLVVWYGCETWFLKLREAHRLRVLHCISVPNEIRGYNATVAAATTTTAANLCLVSLYHIFSTSLKRHDFRIQVTNHKLCVLILCTAYVSSISHSKKHLAKCDIECIVLHVKYLLSLSYFNETSIFLCRFSKNAQMPSFKKIRPVEAKLFQRLYSV